MTRGGELSGDKLTQFGFLSPGFRLGLPRKYLAVVFCKLLKEAGLNSSSVNAMSGGLCLYRKKEGFY